MTELHREQAIEVVKNVCHVLHEKRYEDLPSCVDEMEWDDTGEIRECIQGTLEMNGYDTFDEYGVPCTFQPQYEYHHEVMFFEYKDGSGFAADYELTCGGELVYLTLQLEFLYENGGLKRVFRTIDPQKRKKGDRMTSDTLKFKCVGIPEGGRFPLENTGRGADRSPEFILEGLSPQAVTLAAILEDMSHPIRGFPHWLIWDLPAVPKIPGGLPPGRVGDAVQGLAYGRRRYAGPKPPAGRSHTYRFTLYALDCRLKLPAWSGKRRFLRAAEGHILQKGVLCAIFE